MLVRELKEQIQSIDKQSFDELALQVFQYQAIHCDVYKQFLSLIKFDTTNIRHVAQIPFLPIELFKSLKITDNTLPVREAVFESSSTTGTGTSKHFVSDLQWYEQSFVNCFNEQMGPFEDYCHLALLPSYLERSNSSLIHQVNYFVEHSKYKESAFYLYNHQDLYHQLLECDEKQIPTVLWGVSFALLEFVENYKMQLNACTIIETGGMKGRKKEITRAELHQILKDGFGVTSIVSEYGMTELLSQSYAQSEGDFCPSSTMKIHIREINDPFSGPLINRHGAINIIDLSNLHSCSFIASSDLGKADENGRFEVLGRIDHSDTRGCNLLLG
jgi:hypothetical protein